MLATISDRKIGHNAGNGTVDYYTAEVLTANDYYPFGMIMPGRKYTSSTSKYRYGFNGKEKDNQTYGDGNEYDYGERIYDPRLGRFLSVDPLTKDYPHYTPYQFAGNTPIQAIDLDGAEEYHYTLTLDKNTGVATLKLDKVVTEKSFLGITWTPKLTYYIEYPQGGLLDRSYTFTEQGFSTRGNTIADFEKWLSNPGAFRNPENSLSPNTIQDLGQIFYSDAAVTLSYVNESLAAGFQLKSAGLIRTRVPTVEGEAVSTPSAKTNKQATVANGGNTEPAKANTSANPTFTYEGNTYEVTSNVPYKRPANATNQAQRNAVNQPNAKCVTCGTSQGPFNADHKTPLAVEQLSTGTINKTKMKSVEAVQPQCKTCSNKQGGTLRKITGEANKKITQKNNGKAGT